MDANGLRFWSLADEGDWNLGDDAPEFHYDRERRTLQLRSFRELSITEPPTDPEALLAVVPQAVDFFDTYAYFDAFFERVVAAGAADGEVTLGEYLFMPLSDLALGYDGILYVVVLGGLELIDPRQRWPKRPLSAPGMNAFRLTAIPEGGVIVLDRSNRSLWITEGEPFPQAGFRQYDGDVFRPDEENPDAPQARALCSLSATEDPVAIAANSQGDCAVLCWLSGRRACLRRVFLDGRLGPELTLGGIERPFSVGWLDASTAVVLVQTDTGVEAVPYAVPLTDSAVELPPLGGVFPLVNYTNGPLAHTLQEPARYPSQAPTSATPDLPRRLIRVSPPELRREGVIPGKVPLDSGKAGTEWHRIYLEAILPSQCGVRVLLAATETATPPTDDAEYFPHVFGDVPTGAGVPRGVWSSFPSEVPFSPSLTPCSPEPHRAGLFSALVQRAGRRVTTLEGRYLHVKVELVGNSRATPEIAALRVYGSRFSYVDQYLPRLYHEQVFPPDADDETTQTTPADFLERFLGNFEGVLTLLEDRIANAHLLTDPESAPEDALEWIGQWIGFVFDPAYPPSQRRRALKSAMELHRWHGTLRGLTLALNILTDDALERGEVVVVEDFRLRRTFATILGADLADEEDPLTAGIVDSGNSYVGDTLILGKEFQREFLAVFREVLPERPKGYSVQEWVSYIYQRYIDPYVVDNFFDRFANRLTVLVQKETTEDRVRLIERILELEAPAHLQTQVVRATHPFIVGLASLVGVDTFLREPEPLPPTQVGTTRVGTSFLLRPVSLDPRLEVEA